MTEQEMKRNEWLQQALAAARMQETALYEAWKVDCKFFDHLKPALMAAEQQAEYLKCLTAYSVRVVCANTLAVEHDSKGGAA